MVAVKKHGWDGSYEEITCTVVTAKAVTKGQFVTGGAGGVFDLAAVGLILGIASESKTAGQKVVIYTAGVFTISAAAGDDFDVGEIVYPHTDGTLIDGAAGNYPCGAALTDFAVAGSGDFVLNASAIHPGTVVP